MLARGANFRKTARMSSEGTENPANGAPGMPQLQIVAQYIKDLSFENPGAPNGLRNALDGLAREIRRDRTSVG